MVSDEQIQTDIMNALTKNACVGEEKVLVLVTEGNVTLTGTVASRAAKHHAGYEALFVRGVRNVSNRLEVLFPNDTIVPREVEIQQTVENILSWHSGLAVEDIQVAYRAGVATLTGHVSTDAQRKKATKLVAGINGVSQVSNQLLTATTEAAPGT